MKRLVDEYSNLAIICNVRVDAPLYALAPEKTGKQGRPRARGKRLSLKGFTLKAVPGNGCLTGRREAKATLFGKRSVRAIAAKSEKSGQRRLFLCTKNPKELRFDLSPADAKAALYAKADPDLLPFTIYGLRWNIETAYYERKTFRALGGCRLRSGIGIERLINLLTLRYSVAKLLPYSCGVPVLNRFASL